MQKVVNDLRDLGLHIKTMESCTGGYIANKIMDCIGASGVLMESLVTYSNQAKIKHGVPAEIIERYTVYSMYTAIWMAKACLEGKIRADIGIGVTGNFSNVDPKNKEASKPGIVYVCILTKLGEDSFKVEVPTNISRERQKNVVYTKVLQHLRKDVERLKQLR